MRFPARLRLIFVRNADTLRVTPAPSRARAAIIYQVSPKEGSAFPSTFLNEVGAEVKSIGGPQEMAAAMNLDRKRCILAVNHSIYQKGFSLSSRKAHQSAKIHGRNKGLFGLMVNELLSISMGYLTRKGRIDFP